MVRQGQRNKNGSKPTSNKRSGTYTRTSNSICHQNGDYWEKTWRNSSRRKDTQPWRIGRECGDRCLRRVRQNAAFKLFRGFTPFQHTSSLLSLPGARCAGQLVFSWAKRGSVIKISYQSIFRTTSRRTRTLTDGSLMNTQQEHEWMNVPFGLARMPTRHANTNIPAARRRNSAEASRCTRQSRYTHTESKNRYLTP